MAFAAQPSLVGNWARDDGTTRIDITQCGQNFCAVNTWVKNPAGSEKVGDQLVLSVTPRSADVLAGKAYDERRKRSYSMTVKLSGTHMRTSGCVLLGVVCKSAQWTRTN